MADEIFYTVKSVGGGVDGRDPSDKGGKITSAFRTRPEAEKKKGSDSRFTVHAEVYDPVQVMKGLLTKLDGLQRLVLEEAITAGRMPDAPVVRGGR